MECDDLDVEVDLPVLGLTGVLPFPGEVVLGDICIDHQPTSPRRERGHGRARRP